MSEHHSGSDPTIVICSYLEPHHVSQVKTSAPGKVLYAPDLLPVPRFPNDHSGSPPNLDQRQRRRWLTLLRHADVAFDFDWMAPGDLPTNAPNLRWVQATSAGIGGFVQRHQLNDAPFLMTTAAGVHANPLAEFAVAGVLHFVREIPKLQLQQRNHHWTQYSGGQLADRNVTIVGMGSMGTRIATAFTALHARVTEVIRPERRPTNPDDGTRRVTTDELDSVLPTTDVLILSCPLTDQTNNLINAHRLALLPVTSIVVNLARGPVIDEEALTRELTDGTIGAAVLDVFTREPLPTDSRLWDLPNVLVSPHSASTAANENQLLTDLFLDNLSRYLAGAPLRNPYCIEAGY